MRSGFPSDCLRAMGKLLNRRIARSRTEAALAATLLFGCAPPAADASRAAPKHSEHPWYELSFIPTRSLRGGGDIQRVVLDLYDHWRTTPPASPEPEVAIFERRIFLSPADSGPCMPESAGTWPYALVPIRAGEERKIDPAKAYSLSTARVVVGLDAPSRAPELPQRVAELERAYTRAYECYDDLVTLADPLFNARALSVLSAIGPQVLQSAAMTGVPETKPEVLFPNVFRAYAIARTLRSGALESEPESPRARCEALELEASQRLHALLCDYLLHAHRYAFAHGVGYNVVLFMMRSIRDAEMPSCEGFVLPDSDRS